MGDFECTILTKVPSESNRVMCFVYLKSLLVLYYIDYTCNDIYLYV